MRRLAPYTLSALTVLSLLLCVGTVGMWVRSYRHADLWLNETGSGMYGPPQGPIWQRQRSLLLSRGAIQAQDCLKVWFQMNGWLHEPVGMLLTEIKPPPPDYPVYRQRDASAPPAVQRYYALGIEIVWPVKVALSGTPSFAEHTTSITIPLWLVAMLCAVLPARAVRRVKRRQRKGYCFECGYDLRATPDRCPECGRVPPKATT